MSPEQITFETTDDAVLGGRLRLHQPKRGHRVGHDAILLAAATDAHAGEQAVDLGAGVGAAGLALAARVPGLDVTLVEIDPGLCALAAENARRNGMAEWVRVLADDVENLQSLPAASLAVGSIDRVLMNPPFNDARRQNVSPDARRRLAHVAEPGLISRWLRTAAMLLKSRGVLTLIWRADGLDEVLAVLAPYFGSVAVLPIYPRVDAPAIRVLVRTVKSGEGGRRDFAGLVLNDERGPTAAAEAILRGGEPLRFEGEVGATA